MVLLQFVLGFGIGILGMVMASKIADHFLDPDSFGWILTTVFLGMVFSVLFVFLGAVVWLGLTYG